MNHPGGQESMGDSRTIMTVVGARPQFIKAATVSRALKAFSNVTEVLVHTGQHYDPMLSAVFFEDLDIPTPDINLNIGSHSHGVQTGRMLERLEAELQQVRPDWLVVYGDTNSTLAAALAAAKLHIPVAHVEAGLRSRNKQMPEEVNRILTDHVSELLFTPTQTASRNLLSEGFGADQIKRVGDVMYDAALYYASIASNRSTILSSLDLLPKQYILATIHRAENTNDKERLTHIFDALGYVSKKHRVLIPLHPRTRAKLDFWGITPEGLEVVNPVGYLDMIMLEQHAMAIVTDSGGVQKEAFFHRVPCITLRNETEWEELVKSGWNRLVHLHSASGTAAEIEAALDFRPASAPPLYGDGTAAQKIVTELLNYYS